jgi:hypothetical protein
MATDETDRQSDTSDRGDEKKGWGLTKEAENGKKGKL